MKKLMIAAAIVCAAAFVQAAQFQWVALDVMKDDALYSGSATLTLWDTTVGGSATFGGTMEDGMINEYVGDASGADKGFIVQGHSYDAQYTMTAADGSVFTSEKQTNIVGLFPSENQVWFNGGSWQSVPEPTSGLLLLIGVAGLALKRKRA